MVLFSIIVPIYKVENYLADCVQSILNQTFQDFELILIDDGSPDSCPQLCDTYALQDKRVRVFHKENGGSSSARNYGIEKSRGEYILFVDSDDKYKNLDGLEKLAERIDNYHEDVIQISSEDFYQETGHRRLARGNYDYNIINQNNKNLTINYLYQSDNFAGSAWLICVRKSLLTKYDIRFPIGLTAEDYIWILKIIFYSKSYGATNGLTYEYKKGGVDSITSRARVSGVNGIHEAITFWMLYSNSWSKGIDNFVAYIYIVMLRNYAGLSKLERQIVENKVREDLITLKFSRSFKFRLFYRVIKLIGIKRSVEIIRLIK